MDDFGIVFENEIYYLDESILAPGQIEYLGLVFCFQFDGGIFPCPGWVDSANIVIFMWAEQLLRNVNNKTASFQLPFFEGSYRIDVLKDGNDVTLRAVEGYPPKERIKYEQTGKFSTLFNTVYDTICKLLRFIYIDPRFFGRAVSMEGSLAYYKNKMGVYIQRY